VGVCPLGREHLPFHRRQFLGKPSAARFDTFARRRADLPDSLECGVDFSLGPCEFSVSLPGFVGFETLPSCRDLVFDLVEKTLCVRPDMCRLVNVARYRFRVALARKFPGLLVQCFEAQGAPPEPP